MESGLLLTGLKMTVALLVVLSIFGGSVLLFKKFAGRSQGFLKKNLRDNAKPMEILSFKSLGPSRGLYLIRCMNQKILVGATNNQISHIADIEDEEADFDASLGDEMKENTNSPKNFKGTLRGSLKDIARV